MVHLISEDVTYTIAKAGPFSIDNFMPGEKEIPFEKIKTQQDRPPDDDYKLPIDLNTISIRRGEYLTDIDQSIIGLEKSQRDYIEINIDDILYEAENKRKNMIYALLLRREALEILDIISSEYTLENKYMILEVITKSKNHFQTMANLVCQDIISLDGFQITITPAGKRFIQDIVEGKWND